MGHDIGQLIIALLLIVLPALLLLGTVERARQGNRLTAGASAKGTLLASFTRTREIKAKARSVNWLEHGRHLRKMAELKARNDAALSGGPAAKAPSGAAAGSPLVVPGSVVPGPRAAAPAARGAPDVTPRKTARQAEPSAPQARTSPAPAPGPVPQPTPPGGSTVPASVTGAVEQVIEGVHGIHAHAQAGNIHAKHAAIKALAEICVRVSAAAGMLSRALSEPSSNYGTEITEPIAKCSQYLDASAMSLGESDAAIASLKHMTVGELADSPRQAPHHSELTEGGGH